jgi:hypothetical protein
MRSRWLRLVALLSLVVFSITSTPGAARALGRWLHSAATPAGVCPCCHEAEDHDCLEDADCQAAIGHHDGGPGWRQSNHPRGGQDLPGCPLGPCCPNPTCWCHLASTPFCTPAAVTVAGPIPDAGPLPAEALLSFPPSPRSELMRPPRA